MLLAILFVYVGFVALALMKNRHLHALWPGVELSSADKNALSFVGWTLLILAGAYLIDQRGIGNGLVEYCAVLSAAGLVLVLQFTYHPRSVLALGFFAKPTSASPHVEDV
jgi:Protein of unknown function (DUF3325).